MDKRVSESDLDADEKRRHWAPLSSLDSELRETLRTFWRHKWTITGIMALLTGLAVLYVQTSTPRYTAELQVVFENKTGPLFDFQAAVAGAPQDESSILTELEVLKSRTLAKRVIDDLKLDQDPEFNASLRPESQLQTFLRETLGFEFSAEEPKQDQSETWLTAEELRDIETNAMIDAVLSNIEASQIPRSRAVNITFTSESPRTAARVLNTISEQYLVARLEDKYANAQRASQWLAERIQKLRHEVEASEAEIEAYRKQHGLFEGKQVPLVTEHVSDLNAKLTDATIERRAAESQLAQVQALLNSENAIESAAQVLDSPLIQGFRSQELELERKAAEMGENLGLRHPAMIQLQAETTRLRERVKAEIAKIVLRAKNEVLVARGREQALQRDLEAVKVDLSDANQSAIGLRTLERESEANKLLLEQFLSAFMTANAQEDMRAQVPDARIISPAPLPSKPSYPRKVFIVAVALIGSALFGCLVALALESLDAGFRSAEQVEAATDLPVLAHVPMLTNSKAQGDRPETYVLKHMESAYAEAIRSLATRLLLAFPGTPPKVIVLTSAEPDEGKTTIGLSFVRMQAAMGRRTLFIDADFRRSPIASRFPELSEEPGLHEVLSDKVSFFDAIQSDPGSGAHIIVAGNGSTDRKVLADGSRLEVLIDELRSEYDAIVIDAPPALALAEGQVIPTVADATLLVIRWGKTRKRVVRYTLNQIYQFGIAVEGVLLNMVDVRKQAYYGYGDASYYRGKAAKYYSS
ncbi:MAG: polysaccharide biosynthesis tyrosine autokinase [Hyphomicrobiales bacterium]|nr:polysaccharide biosynthesis tyrosine autokinase [Hyphomicrobiales bacterium]